MSIFVAAPPKREDENTIAELGEKWQLTAEPDYKGIVIVHHEEAGRMFTQKLGTGKTASDYIYESIKQIIKK